ncbi:Thioredoxin [Granulicella rosea]|uniref:Thioredoxin n=1 Tax=Granulicella rosea TaxID=474952 RepID=A0A239J6H5_9BACT|nr:thioredoxin domain-containing protein [Granulicella rosea]SNT01272.1 Thioredoxin [Granulicella rosea]
MNKAMVVAALASTIGFTGTVLAQAAPAAAAPAPQKSLQLQSLDPVTKADPFPAVDPKNFTAPSPTLETVDGFLKSLWGYDVNRIWRVEAIQKTDAPGVAKVVVFVSERAPNAQVQSTAFFITPDGKHAVAGGSVISFGAKPFADLNAMLASRADGATRGSVSKKLMLVEFSDLQCPHCKEAQETMKNLERDYPNAHIVYQPFPLVQIHPFAFQAATYGACVAKQKNEAYFTYAQAVYDTQSALTPETGDDTLKAAVTKAGLDPAAVATCAATPAIKEQVNASLKLGEDAGVDQTPMLAVNGRLLPLGAIPYETLKNIIDFTEAEDGTTVAPGLKVR